MKWTFVFLIISLTAIASEKITDFCNTNEHYQSHNTSTSPTINGIILLNNKKDLNPAGFKDVHGIKNYRVDLPGPFENLNRSLVFYCKKPLNKKSISDIKKTIILFYQKNNRPIVSVQIPKQDLSSGVLQLILSEGTLGKIYCKGNKYFRNKLIEKGIQIKSGEPISVKKLNQNLYWLNRNPFRQIDAVYTPGQEKGTTDIELLTVDRFPLRIYGGIDNTGNDITGNNRIFTGFNWGNAFWNDQQLSYQFSTSSDFKRYQSHTLYYEVPLSWRHILNIYGGYAKVDADFSVPNIDGLMFRTHGFSVQTSLRYQIPLIPLRHCLHEMSLGFDFKRTNNNLNLDEHPIISENNVNLTQFQMGYNLGYNTKAVSISLEIEGFWSPFKWVDDQTNLDYQSLRAYAKNKYLYTRGACSFIWRYYKNWSLHTYFRGQLANINLLPSEEYGLGGYNTVRGYKERIVNGDNALLCNLEMHTPPIKIFSYLKKNKKSNEALKLLVFFDYGISGVNRTIPGQNKTEYLMSVGPGIRYSFGPYLTLRTDWGFQLHNLELGGPKQRIDFALVVGY